MATQTARAAKLQATIEAQAKRLAELKAKKVKIDAKGRSKEKAVARKLENRRLILMGAYLKHRMDDSQEVHAQTMKGLDGFLKRPDERALFGLAVPDSSES